MDKIRDKHAKIEKGTAIIYEGKKAKKNALKELKKDDKKEFITRRKQEIKDDKEKRLKSRSVSLSPSRHQRSPSVSEGSSVSSDTSEEMRKVGPYYSFSDTSSCTSDSSDIEKSEFHENLMNAKRELFHVWSDQDIEFSRFQIKDGKELHPRLEHLSKILKKCVKVHPLKNMEKLQRKLSKIDVNMAVFIASKNKVKPYFISEEEDLDEIQDFGPGATSMQLYVWRVNNIGRAAMCNHRAVEPYFNRYKRGSSSSSY